ncbi:ABC transporter permease [Gluconacetobacter entanii]|uniref:cell division protein FtsL n=1 Tax=Gluconacetobacter entanii TaxID=108528 RepID=UPI001C93288B|nr:ABC transporter permease [Gluconacetobacter entanii]MBY4638761.1 ABC transporter permease [Gluconacetobacter entanii]MCW4581780.1 ABC transporter permease [Gluconacetobacter entanii]MCW4585102.1 ABC transporter permease [Gluconacetobacter entanii]MCW4588736.1 ABC transporter permease [Gluconacetobacter entanii]
MIRIITLLCAIMTAGSGLFLYTKKQQTSALDQKIAQIVMQTERTRDQTAMLRAEWTMLNQPDRLHKLAERYDPTLRPVAPTQFVQVASLSAHLPAPGSPAPIAPPNPRANMGVALAADHMPIATADPVARPHAPMVMPAATLAQASVPHPVAQSAPLPPVVTHHAPPAHVEAAAVHPEHPEHDGIRATPEHAAPRPVEHAAPMMAQNEAPAAHPPVHVAHAATTPAPAHDVMLASTRVAPYHYHPAHEVSEAAWHPAEALPSVRGGGSSLANSRTSALPPPVPVSN